MYLQDFDESNPNPKSTAVLSPRGGGRIVKKGIVYSFEQREVSMIMYLCSCRHFVFFVVLGAQKKRPNRCLAYPNTKNVRFNVVQMIQIV